MPVNGAPTDDELLGHLRVGESLGHQAQDLDFPSRQASRIGDGLSGRSCRCGGRRSGQGEGIWCYDHLLRQHPTPFVPQGCKGLLTQLSTHLSHLAFISRTFGGSVRTENSKVNKIFNVSE